MPRSLRCLMLCCLLLVGISPAQSFLFVSPNTRDHLSDQDAAGSLNSFEQSNFIAVAKYFGKKICGAPHVFSAEGIFVGNAENSILVTGCPTQKARYLGELLGRYAHQKWILVFDPSAEKSDERMFLLEFTPGHVADPIQELRKYNLSGATVIFQDPLARVYVWASDRSQDAAIHALAGAEHATIREIQGKGTLIGNDDRMAAQRIFDERIRAYERKRHVAFSKLLWSKRLHDMVEQQALKVSP